MRSAGRGDIGENVRATKTVDGLFRIANQENRRRTSVVNLRKDRILNRIGILKFVDEGGGKTLPQRFAQRLAPVSSKSFLQLRQ